MLDFDIRRTNRQCAGTGRTLEAGEVFYSALFLIDGEFERRDYSADAWQDQVQSSSTDDPESSQTSLENCVGWWRSQIPQHDAGKVYWAPPDVLIRYFEAILAAPEKAETAYVMALALVRKRVLQLVDSQTDDQMVETLVVESSRFDKSFSVPVCPPARENLERIQAELSEHLFMDQPPTETD